MIPVAGLVQLGLSIAQAVPQVVALIQEAKKTATGTDLAELERAEAAIAQTNDAAHARIQGST